MSALSPSAPIAVNATIRLDHLRHNARVLREHACGASLMAVVKANAYGHGAAPVAKALSDEGIDYFAVANVPEGIELRRAGVDAPIQVFAAPLTEHLPAYADHNLGITVSSPAVADAVRRLETVSDDPLRVHVKVETGMSRLGVSPDDVESVLQRLSDAPHVQIITLWTHFATADEQDLAFTREQLARFRAVLDDLPAALLQDIEHIDVANSAALLALPDEVTSFPDPLIRTGLSLYGVAPRDGMRGAEKLRPALRFTARVTHLKTVEAGSTISYGRTWTAEKATRIATVGAGYADGYPRLVSNRADVGIRGRRYPVVGTVCMDMFMVNIGTPDGPDDVVKVGDEVVLMGEGGPTAHEIAHWAETIPYEVMTSIGARVPRVFTASD